MASDRNQKPFDGNNDAIGKVITEEDINAVAERFTNDKSVKVLSYSFDDYSSGKLGFLGSHKSLKIILQRSDENSSETADFFVKSMPYNNKEQAEFMKKDRIFPKESNFFKIIPKLMNNCDITRWFPMCYLAKEDVIILEDLRSQGYRMHDDIWDNPIVLKSVLSNLARLHSCTILTEARLSQDSKKLVRLNERYPDYFAEKMLQKLGYGARWFYVGAKAAGGIAERLGYDSAQVHNAYEKLFDIVKPSEKYCNVICHGDLWGNNLMFAESSPLLKCIFVDFQIIRYAPLVTDLLQFLHLNASRGFREKHEMELVKFYHSTLQEIVKRNDSTSTAKVPTLEEISKGMDDLRVFGLVMPTLYFPFALLDPKIIAECTKDSESYNNYVFGNRLDTVLVYMKEDVIYKSRIEEAVIELIEKT